MVVWLPAPARRFPFVHTCCVYRGVRWTCNSHTHMRAPGGRVSRSLILSVRGKKGFLQSGSSSPCAANSRGHAEQAPM